MYPTVFTSSAQYHILLHILSFYASIYIAQGLVSDIIAPYSKPDPAFTTVLYFAVTCHIPTDGIWSLAYDQDSATKEIIGKIRSRTPVNQSFISSIHSSSRQTLATYQLQLLNHRLVLLEPVDTPPKHFCWIVVPSSLERDILYICHVSPSTADVGKYKTPYRIKFRLFWPTMWTDIKNKINACTRCNITYRWRIRGSDLLFS